MPQEFCRRQFSVSISTTLMLTILGLPFACASDSVPVEQGEISAGSAKQRAVAFPKSAAGVLAGLTIGVPVKISKDIRKETRRLAGTLRGDVGNEFGLTENAFVLGGAIPFGILSGMILGTIRGTERAVTYGAQQPFSKESLGLKEPEQEPKEQLR